MGKLGDFRLPGGPYTLTQMLTAAGVITLGKWSMGVWGSHMPTLLAWSLLLLVGVGSGILIGRVPLGGRNPLLIVWGVVGYFDAPAWGTVRGKKVVIGRTRRMKVRCSQAPAATSVPVPREPAALLTSHRPAPLEEDAPAVAPELPVPVGAPPSRAIPPHQLTQIQQLLAASAQRR